jgi:SAM-dependent methyltransferase
MASRLWRHVPLSDIRPEIGFAYIAATNRPWLSSHRRASNASVLEDGVPLPGPANAPHDGIRQIGQGRFSFWHNYIYFSASDNSDPRTNGRSYEISYTDASSLWVPAWLHSVGNWIREVQHFRQPIGQQPVNLQTRNSAPEDLRKDVEYALQVGGGWVRLLSERFADFRGKIVLEIGPGINFGSTLLLACLGAQVMVADRFLAPWDDNYHPRFYALLREWIERNHPGADLAPLSTILSSGRYCAESIRLFTTPLEKLDGVEKASVDVVLSNAVLEHLADPLLAFRQLARVSKPGALGYHQVDFRDHNDFSKPLEFLLSEDRSFAKEFNQRHRERGNRFRPAEYSAFFEKTGFRVLRFLPTCNALEAYLADFLPQLRCAAGSRYQHEQINNLRVIGGLFCVEKTENQPAYSKNHEQSP